MIIKKTASIYMLFVGCMIILLWTFLSSTNNVPEFESEAINISFHITAEIITAALLLISGIGMLQNKRWSKNLSFISLGTLLYTIINSSGYYAQRSEMQFLLMFGILLVLTLSIIILLIKKDAG